MPSPPGSPPGDPPGWKPSRRLRFSKGDRVLCAIEGGWHAGKVEMLDEEDPSDPTGQRKLPYVVKLDAPSGRCAENNCFRDSVNKKTADS
jgi:hypothetical protein